MLIKTALLLRREFIGTAALLALTLTVAQVADSRKPDRLAMPLESLPKTISGWRMQTSQTLSGQVLSRLVPTDYLYRTYNNGATSADVFIAFYAMQRAGETMHSPKACLPGTGWDFSETGVSKITVNGRSIVINRDQIQNAGSRMWMLYWYQSRDSIIANEFVGKLFLIRDSMLDGRTSGSFVRITLPHAPGAVEAGVSLAADIIPQLRKCFSN